MVLVHTRGPLVARGGIKIKMSLGLVVFTEGRCDYGTAVGSAADREAGVRGSEVGVRGSEVGGVLNPEASCGTLPEKILDVM